MEKERDMREYIAGRERERILVWMEKGKGKGNSKLKIRWWRFYE